MNKKFMESGFSIKTEKTKTDFVVYCMIFPNGKRYVGITSNFKRRVRDHKNKTATSDLQVYKAIRKHGFEKVAWEIIDYGEDLKNLSELEICWIEKLNTFFPFGYNLTKGGISELPKPKATVDTKEKIAIAKGSVLFNVYNSCSGEYIGSWINKKQCARDLNIGAEDIWCCLNNKQKTYKGYIFIYADREQDISFYQKKNTRKSNPFYAIKIENGEMIGVWESQRECAKDLSVNFKKISACLNGINKTTGGYSFFYVY